MGSSSEPPGEHTSASVPPTPAEQHRKDAAAASWRTLRKGAEIWASYHCPVFVPFKDFKKNPNSQTIQNQAQATLGPLSHSPQSVPCEVHMRRTALVSTRSSTSWVTRLTLPGPGGGATTGVEAPHACRLHGAARVPPTARRFQKAGRSWTCRTHQEGPLGKQPVSCHLEALRGHSDGGDGLPAEAATRTKRRGRRQQRQRGQPGQMGHGQTDNVPTPGTPGGWRGLCCQAGARAARRRSPRGLINGSMSSQREASGGTPRPRPSPRRRFHQWLG